MNGCVLDFFRTDTFIWKILGSTHRIYKNLCGPLTNDFAGLN